MSTKHTPGPWRVVSANSNGNGVLIEAVEPWLSCQEGENAQTSKLVVEVIDHAPALPAPKRESEPALMAVDFMKMITDKGGRGINGLDLFSGIGGLELALGPWVRTVAYCEVDRYCQGVLLSRMRSGDISEAPIWDDVRTLSAKVLPKIDIIYGGFPCQDISLAGTGAGLDGVRSGLFFEIVRLARELRPRFIFLENVPALTVRGLDRVLLEFTALGFDCRWTIVSAAEVGAPHRRERIWILAHANGLGLREQSDSESKCKSQDVARDDGEKWPLADSNGVRKPQLSKNRHLSRNGTVDSSKEVANTEGLRGLTGRLSSGPEPQLSRTRVSSQHGNWNQWAAEPNVGRVAHGVPARVDRLRGLGNAVVPQSAREAFQRLMGLSA